MKNEPGGLFRCLLVWLSVSAVAAGLMTLLVGPPAAAVAQLSAVDPRRAGPVGAPFDELLVWLCALAAACCVAWLWVVVTLVSAQAACGRGDQALPGVPAAVRRAVLLACGLALVGGLAAPALATPGSVHADGTGRTTSVVLDGLPLPDRATGGAGARRPAAGRPSTPVPVPAPASTARDPSYVVRPGDSLWRITESRLRSHDPAAVAAGVRELHDLNRGVVGDDPDLIQPGQRLELPPAREEPS